VASIEAHLGVVYERQGDLKRAMASTEDALRITIKRLGSDHYMTGYYLDALANLYLDANNLTAAKSSARQALALYANSLPARHLYVSASRRLLGEVLLRRGQFAAAEIEFRRALEIDTALAGAGSWRTARTRASLGWLLILEHQAADGEPLLVAAQSQLLAALGPQHPEVVQATWRLAECQRGHRAEAARFVAPN
jgi:serine/threonine-protein kinase